MGYGTRDTGAGWEVLDAATGGCLRAGYAPDDGSRVLRFRDETACGIVIAALEAGHLELSGTTPEGDPVLDADEYRLWLEDQE